MVQQKVPDIELGEFVFGEINDLFNQKKININFQYQRGDIWKYQQQIELIKSIKSSYSIGVLVLFINDQGQYEIMDGQQRLLAIQKYVSGNLKLKDTGIKPYSELDKKEKTLLDAYCVYFLKIKSFSQETKEEDIVQTFLRLQEGTPLNKAEKINAYRGNFKDSFRTLREENSFFSFLGKERRFRWRLLAAEFLLLELKGDFDKFIFPDLGLDTLREIIKEYESKEIGEKKMKFVTGNLNILSQSLNVLLSALQPRELISFYLLISYLRKKKASNEKLLSEFENFAEDFMKNINSFSVYDSKPSKGMDDKIFFAYKKYKEEARKATTSDSMTSRLKFLIEEYKRLQPFIEKDKQRLYDAEQKRILYFRQKGICPECKKKFKFHEGSAHHVVSHSSGSRTNDLKNAQLLHAKCHERLEKRTRKQKK